MKLVDKNCGACGKPIQVRLADHRRGWGRFCDKACSAAYKCGQRPKDVNAGHAKKSAWAANAMSDLANAGLSAWPKVPSVNQQLGANIKVTPLLHSPPTKRKYATCGACGGSAADDQFGCWECEAHDAAMTSDEIAERGY